MDKLVEHAIRMLEIIEGENDFYRNDAKRQADIARAVYDVILRVQVLERKADRKTEPQTNASQRIQSVGSVETMSCQECRRWIYDDRWGWFCPLKSQDECKYEPKDLEQFRVGLEYHTDNTHFGKVKGESITTNKVEDEPQTEQVGVPFGEMDEATFKSHCLNCQRDTADIKCLDCDGNKYFLPYGSKTERSE